MVTFDTPILKRLARKHSCLLFKYTQLQDTMYFLYESRTADMLQSTQATHFYWSELERASLT